MGRLSDPAESRAVLIGVSRYQQMDELPAVAANVTTLAGLLTDPAVWGLPAANCAVVLDPSSSVEVLEPIHEAARSARDALVVYFAGHGLLDEHSRLYLGLPQGSPARLHHAVHFDEIRREVVLTARRCRAKVVILDCCYSGKAMTGYMSARTVDPPVLDGAYLMTATAEGTLAVAPPDADYTAFTGALVETLRDGVPDGPDPLDMETLFGHVERKLSDRGLPTPQRRSRNEGHRIAIARNRAPTAVPAPPVASAPSRHPARLAVAGSAAALLLLVLLLAAQQVGMFSDARERGRQVPDPGKAPSATGVGTATSTPTRGRMSPTTSSPAPVPGPHQPDPALNQRVTVGVGDTGRTSDGTVDVGVTYNSQDGIGFFVLTSALNCTVDGSTVGDSVVVPELSGSWIRVVVLKSIHPTVDARDPTFDIPVVFAITRGTGAKPKSLPCA